MTTGHHRAGSWEIGKVHIHGPEPGEKFFWIYCDLADLLRTKYTSEAVQRFREEWKRRRLKGRIEIDAEADGATFSAARERITEVARLLHELDPSQVEQRMFDEQMSVARAAIEGYVVPEAIEWKLGDVFAIGLKDASYAYGQVVGDYAISKSSRKPSCALFDQRTATLETDLNILPNAGVITVLHVSELNLTTGKWLIIGNAEPVVNAYSGPCGPPSGVGSISWDGLDVLANAYFGLAPWNEYYKDDYLDKFLLSGVTRPKQAILLSSAELAARGIVRDE